MIHLLKGSGKGKTSAAIGMSIRAAGHGMTVLFIRFLKDNSSGEIQALDSIPQITVLNPPVNHGFIFQMTEEELSDVSVECNYLLEYVFKSDADMIILDEILDVVEYSLITDDLLKSIIHKKCELVMTGSCAPEWILDEADYITEFLKVKHPYDLGIQARIGVEF